MPGPRQTTLCDNGRKTGGSMRKMTVTVEMSVKTLLDIDVLEDLIEDVLLEALHQDQDVEVKVTAEFVKQPISAESIRSVAKIGSDE
jgi:hypothetical protein